MQIVRGRANLMIDYNAIGKRIRKFREMKKRTQEWVAEHSELTPAHLSHIETGNTKVSLPSLLRIANALDVTLDDLVCDNLPHTKHVTLKEMDALLADCSDAEARALVMIAAAGKNAIRNLT